MTVEPTSTTFAEGHLGEALIHYNEALDRLDNQRTNVDTADVMFRCLNKLQTGMTAGEGGEVAGFVQLVRFATRTETMRDRYFSSELRDLASLDPQVMDHNVLGRGGYRPGSNVEGGLLREATAKHRKLRNAIERMDDSVSLEAIDQVIKRSAELLYVVRSNIAHGEKTPYGPDHAKRDRDETVCRLVVPLCKVLVDLLLASPSSRLLAYGTLAPGQPNHVLVESLDGEWSRCSVEASIEERAGLPVLSWQPGSGAVVEAVFLESRELAANWQRLDAFEGSRYRRRLLPASPLEDNRGSGVIVVSAYVGA